MSDEEKVANRIGNQQQVSLSAKSQPMNVKLWNEGNGHFDSKINTHERDVELPDRDVHSDSDAERPNTETRTKPRLSKYVRSHHPAE